MIFQNDSGQQGIFAPVGFATPGNIAFFESTGNAFFRPSRNHTQRQRVGGIQQKSGFFASSLNPHGFNQEPVQTYKKPIHKNLDNGDFGAYNPIANVAPPPLPEWREDPVPTYKKPTYFRQAAVKQSIQFLSFNMLPFGFDLQNWQPQRIRYKNLDRGDEGTQNTFTFVPSGGIAEFGHDPIWADLRLPIRPKYPALTGHDDDAKNNAFAKWYNAGWEIQPPQPPHKWFKSPEFNNGQGIDNLYQQWRNQGWTVQYIDIRHKGFRSPEAAYNIDVPFISWQNAGWQVQDPQPPHLRYKNLDRGDEGIENIFTAVIVPPLPEWGHDPTWADLRHIWFKSPEFNNGQGIDSPFQQWYNQGWPVQYSDIKHPKFNSPDIGDGGIQNTFTFVPAGQLPEWGHDPTWADLRHIWKHSPDFNNGQGIDAQLINWFNAGWEIQPPQPPHKWFKSPETGDDAAKYQIIKLPEWGHDPTWADLRHIWRKSPETGDPGIQDLQRFFQPYGWEKAYEHIKHPKFNSPEVGSQGIEGPFVPPGFVTGLDWFFQTTVDLPFRYKHSPEIGDQGIEDIFRFFQAYGWEKPYEHVKHPRYINYDRGHEGIDAQPFFLIPLGQWDFPTQFVYSRTQFGGRKFAALISYLIDAGVWPPGTINPIVQTIFDYIVRARRRKRR